jgi:hypothetical protein
MVSFTACLIAFTAAISVIAAPVEGPAESAMLKRSSPNSSGTNNGFYYQFCEFRTQPLFQFVHVILHQGPMAAVEAQPTSTREQANTLCHGRKSRT